MNITVFCSSSSDLSPVFLAECERVGRVLAEDGHSVIYGGSSAGAMGALAQGVLSAGGELVGVVPEMEFFDGREQDRLTRCHRALSLGERKELMLKLADAFLVLPGGLGTLDEAFEVLALKSIGSIQKPVVFFNFLDLWTPLLEALDLLAEQRFLRRPVRELAAVLDKVEELREHPR